MLTGIQNVVIAQESIFSRDFDTGPIIKIVRMFTEGEESSRQSSEADLLDELTVRSTVIREGTDEALRPMFVNIQTNFEKALVYLLKDGLIEGCTCIIHTPSPPTPLCTNGEISTDLVDSVISNDPKRLPTVQKRPDVLREYLHAGGRLLAVYPKKGRMLRSAEQLTVFDSLLERYPRFATFALDCDQMPDDLIGATYLIRVAESKYYVLSFRSYQANSPTDGIWTIWFGSPQDPVIMKRFEKVSSFLEEQGLLRDFRIRNSFSFLPE